MAFLRKIFRRVTSRDPQTNKVDILEINDDYHKLSDEDDSVETYEFKDKPSLSCGCLADAKIRCYECSKLSCSECGTHCGVTKKKRYPQGCGKPLCGDHSNYKTMPDAEDVPFCSRCYGKVFRTQLWMGAGKGISGFLFEKKGQKDV